MTTTRLKKAAGVCLAAISMTVLLADATVAAAQPDQGYPQDQGGGQYGGQPGDGAPPQGQYAPPPPGYENGGQYDAQSQQYDSDYGQRYSAWAAQYCVDQHNNNVAAGAVIGGVFGALLGAGAAGPHNAGAGALVGGALGAGTGAAIGASSGAPAAARPAMWCVAGRRPSTGADQRRPIGLRPGTTPGCGPADAGPTGRIATGTGRTTPTGVRAGTATPTIPTTPIIRITPTVPTEPA